MMIYNEYTTSFTVHNYVLAKHFKRIQTEQASWSFINTLFGQNTLKFYLEYYIDRSEHNLSYQCENP